MSTVSVKALILTIMLSSICMHAAPAIAATTLITNLKDRQGKNYKVIKNLKGEGVKTIEYQIGAKEMYKTVLEGKYLDENSTCADAEKLSSDIQNLLIRVNYKINDFNGDGLDDIRFNYVEQNCSSKEKAYKEIYYYTRKNELKRVKTELLANDTIPEVTFQPMIIIQDKGGEYYELRQYYALNHGRGTYQFDFGKENDPTNKRTLLYSGNTWSEAETCPLDGAVAGDKALIKHIVKKTDLNNDGIQDITLELEEMTCSTKQINSMQKKIISGVDGFKVLNRGESI